MICRERTIKGKTTKYYYCNILKKAVDDNKCEICPIRRKYENEKVNRIFKMMFGGWK